MFQIKLPTGLLKKLGIVIEDQTVDYFLDTLHTKIRKDGWLRPAFLNSKVCFCIVRCFRSMTAPSLQRCSSNSCCFDVKGVSCLLLSNSSSSSLQRIPPSRPESLHLLEKLSTMQYLCSQRIPATKRSW